mmetsp:Transcript_1943/g.3685  ORF Transcript_1943/g.3685 Transcript_1943/m.3685 type:complete len:126 (+) Transcript_1943:1185-1562(+)
MRAPLLQAALSCTRLTTKQHGIMRAPKPTEKQHPVAFVAPSIGTTVASCVGAALNNLEAWTGVCGQAPAWKPVAPPILCSVLQAPSWSTNRVRKQHGCIKLPNPTEKQQPTDVTLCWEGANACFA